MTSVELPSAAATREVRPPNPLPRPRPIPSRARRLALAWTTLALLALLETLFLTIRHDATNLERDSDEIARIVSTAPDILRILVCSAVAALTLTAWRLRGRFASVVNEVRLATGLWPWLPAHLAVFALVELSSRRVFGGTPASGAQYLVWLLLVAGSALSWLASAIRPRFWPALIRSGRGAIAAGILFGICTWGASHLAHLGWERSAAPTFWAVERLLRLAEPDVVTDPDTFVLGTATFRVRFAAECSGYEGVGLVCLYLGLYLVLFRRDLRFPQSLLLIPIGAVAAWSLNVIRIAVLIAIGDSGSPELAFGGFHSQAGWLAFNAVALGLVFLSHQSRLFASRPLVAASGANPTAAYLAPLLSVVALQMVAEALFNGSPVLYPLRVALGAACLAYYRRAIRGTATPDASKGHSSFRGLVVAVLAGTLVFAIWVELWLLLPSHQSEPDPRESVTGLSDWALVSWLAFRVVGSVLVLPLIEEIAFRGYLLRRLVSADFRSVSPRQFTWPALLASAALFGLLHDQWLAGMLAGLVYGAVYAHRGRLLDAVIAHGTTNAMITLVALTTGHWQIWS